MTTPPRPAVLAIIILTLAGLGVWWLVHPICVPLTADAVREFARWSPIEERTDRQLHGPVFQRRNGQWFQCKSWVSRQLFL